MTIPQAFDLALQHHRAGRLAEAEALYRQILAAQPNHANSLHLLGLIAYQVGRHDLALEWIAQAIIHDPDYAAAHSNLGEVYRATGRLEEAMAAYRRALQIKPDFPEALNNLSDALRKRERFDEAIAASRRALEIKPNYPDALNNLGAALAGQRRFDEAIVSFRRAIELDLGHAEAINNLGAALVGRGRLEEAVLTCRRALLLKPDHEGAHYNLGVALARQGQLDGAIAAYRDALRLRPSYPDALNNLGNALRERGHLDEAIAAYRNALQLKPDSPETLNNLGNALKDQGEWDKAIAVYRRALELNPDYPEAQINIGAALTGQGQLDDAIVACRRALQLKSDYPEALNNLGNALKYRGELDEALASYRRALHVEPKQAWAHSNLVHSLHYHPNHNARAISEEHQRWNRLFSEPLKQFVQPHGNDRSPERRLRIGYISPDFRDHPVGRYVLPLFECHDPERFEILCYSEVARPDFITERLRALAVGWRSTIGVANDRLAKMIREDRVDILVDLALHTAGNRLPVFARQPAPVQVTWLGYPGSTGLPIINYRLTDAYLEPPGMDPAWSAEESLRLPNCWCCYHPADESPEINSLPALIGHGVTFGSLNNFAKVNERVLALWAHVMQAVEQSRLLMFCPEGQARERVRGFFSVHGIAVERVEFTGFTARWKYLSLYHRIDIGLDPFPYNGMTTTCDALWMGVPILTMPGEMPASRAGLSILSNVGLEEFAAHSEEDYVRIAVELAGDLPRLAELRSTLRKRMETSVLMDAPCFARNIEAAYRSMWERWCATGT